LYIVKQLHAGKRCDRRRYRPVMSAELVVTDTTFWVNWGQLASVMGG
jgi:hypothetical protein